VQIEPGAIFTALIAAVLLASGVAWLVAGLYRRRMVSLMRGGPSPDDARSALRDTFSILAERPQVVFDAAANRRAQTRFLLALSGLSLLIGFTQSWLAIAFVYDDRAFSFNRLLVLGIVYAWPMVLGWGLVLRWSWGRVLLAVLAYVAGLTVLAMLRSDGDQTLSGVLSWLVTVVALPIVITLLISASGRIRAVAPYLLPVFLLLATASVLTLQWFGAHASEPTEFVRMLIYNLGVSGTFLFYIFAPWLLLAWPMYELVRWLARAYLDKRFSDLGYLYGAYWFVVLFSSTLPAVAGNGAIGLTQLLPWFWIPVLMVWARDWLKPVVAPPTLLVLRVFQRDAAVEILFDRVVERWRLTGNTVLIAGTDLVSRTLDPDDLFAFLNGRLAERFIASEDEAPRRVAALDLAPDPDGRYRVNECYCFDTTWQAALRALVQASDVVLMDLRGFRAENRGCRFELGVLAQSPRLRRVVLLRDKATDLDAAAMDLAGAPAERFVWLDAGRLDGGKTRQVLAALFGETTEAIGLK
jgi:hypothetical protein